MHVRRWFTIIHAWHGLHSKLSTDWTCIRTWMSCIILYHIALLCFKLHDLHRKNSSLKAEGSSTSRFWGVGTLLQRIGRCLRKRATAVRRHCVRELIMQQILRFLHLLAFTMSTFFIFFDIDFTSVILKVLLLLWFEESRAHHGFALPPVPGTVPTLRGDCEFLATAQSQWCLLTTWHWWFRMVLAKRRHLWISMASWVFDREMFYRELWFLTWAVVFSEVLNQAPRATSTTKCLLVKEDSDKAATELRYVLLNTKEPPAVSARRSNMFALFKLATIIDSGWLRNHRFALALVFNCMASLLEKWGCAPASRVWEAGFLTLSAWGWAQGSLRFASGLSCALQLLLTRALASKMPGRSCLQNFNAFTFQ